MGSKKGHFSQRNVVETPWGKKTKHLTATLSEEGWRLVKERAKQLKISVSEVLERWGREYDVSFGRSEVLPPELDTTREWKPTTQELLDRLTVAIAEDREVVQFYAEFIDKIGDGTATLEDLTELTSLKDLSDEQMQRYGELIQSFSKKGKKTNGV